MLFGLEGEHALSTVVPAVILFPSKWPSITVICPGANIFLSLKAEAQVDTHTAIAIPVSCYYSDIAECLL